MKHPFVRKIAFCALAVLIGCITAFAMPPASLWPLMIVGIAALYWLYSRTETPLQAFAAGFFFAIGYFVTGLWWIGNALLIEGNEFAWVWPISVIGLPTLLALFTATYLAITRLTSKPKTLSGVLTFAFFLTVSEWTRGHAFTGFPWNLYGYTWADYLPMAQGFFIFGSFGMTFLTLVWATSFGYAAIRNDLPWKQRLAPLVLVVVTMAALYGWGVNRLENNPTKYNHDAGVIVAQPNIPQTMKWDPEATQDNFLKITALSIGAQFGPIMPRSVFVVWPETAISPSVYMQRENVDRMQAMLRSYKNMDAYLITGILHRDDSKDPPTFSNSIAFLNNSMTTLELYSKFHLVPFGEFIPLQKYIPLKPVAAFNGFERGTGATTITRANVPPFSPLVCYEVIFPDDVVSKYSDVRPQWIVNVTNDGWYGKSAGPYQHFAQTRLRAIEEGLPVVRSANTGISGIIDSYGRVIDSAELDQEASIVSLLPRTANKTNPFWPWALQPLLFFISLALMFAALKALVPRK